MMKHISESLLTVSLVIFITCNLTNHMVTFSTASEEIQPIAENFISAEALKSLETAITSDIPLENSSPTQTYNISEEALGENHPSAHKKNNHMKKKRKKFFQLKKLTNIHYEETILPSRPIICRRGIDVSHHNKEINWQAVKDSGIEFAIIRTSYGWENWDKQTDRQLKNNIAGAKAAGIHIGAYHYSYATNPQEALLEANFFIDCLKGTQWEYPVFIDLEDKCQKNLTNEQRTEIILTFLQCLQKAGYYTGFYTCLNWQRYMLDMNQLGGHQLWIAHWHPNCGCTCPYGIWQYTSDGNVPGIEGRVDMDICYIDYPSIIKNLHLNGF